MGKRRCKPLKLSVCIDWQTSVEVCVSNTLHHHILWCYPVTLPPVDIILREVSGKGTASGQVEFQTIFSREIVGVVEAKGGITQFRHGGFLTTEDGTPITDEDENKIYIPIFRYIDVAGGVSVKGQIQADDFETNYISVSGKSSSKGIVSFSEEGVIQVSGKSSSKGSVSITKEGEIQVSGKSSSKGSVSITKEGEIQVSGKSSSKGSVSITKEGETRLDVKGKSTASGAVTVNSEFVRDVSGITTALGAVTFHTQFVRNVSGITTASGSVERTVQFVRNVSGKASSKGTIGNVSRRVSIAVSGRGSSKGIVGFGAEREIPIDVSGKTTAKGHISLTLEKEHLVQVNPTKVTAKGGVDIHIIKVILVEVGGKSSSKGTVSTNKEAWIPVTVSGKSTATGTVNTIKVALTNINIGGKSSSKGTVETQKILTLQAPTGLASCKESDLIKLTWNAVADTSNYRVERENATDNPGAWTLIAQPTGTTHWDPTPGQTGNTNKLYNYRVRAVRSGDVSGPSDPVNVLFAFHLACQ